MLFWHWRTSRKGSGSADSGIAGILIIGIAKEGKMWAEGPYLHAFANLGGPLFSLPTSAGPVQLADGATLLELSRVITEIGLHKTAILEVPVREASRCKISRLCQACQQR